MENQMDTYLLAAPHLLKVNQPTFDALKPDPKTVARREGRRLGWRRRWLALGRLFRRTSRRSVPALVTNAPPQ
jgi:hypothetical protein